MVRRYKLFRARAKKFIPQEYRSSVLKRESHIRSILKGISWRIIGTLSTVCIAFILTGDVTSAMAIGGIEVISKFILYYFHERLWQLAPRGTLRKLIENA